MADAGAATCAAARVPLPRSTIRWFCIDSDSVDALSVAMREMQVRQVGTRTLEKRLDEVLAQMQTQPLYALDSQQNTLWLYDAWNAPMSDVCVDVSMLHVREFGTWTGPETWCGKRSNAHTYFLRALEHALADAHVTGYENSTNVAVRVAPGVLYLPSVPPMWSFRSARMPTLLRIRVHATVNAITATYYAHAAPYAPLDMRMVPGESIPRNAVCGETHVAMLPTLTQATLLGTMSDPQTPATMTLQSNLQPTLAQVSSDDTALAILRVCVRAPPRTMSVDTDAFDRHVLEALDQYTCTVLWPASLCLCVEEQMLEGPALLSMSAEALLDAVEWAPPTTSPTSPESQPSVESLPSVACVPAVEDDDVFAGIQQLTADDLSFFETNETSIRAGNGKSHDIERQADRQLAPKYDMFGKFYAEQQRPSSEIRALAVSPRALFGPASLPSPYQASVWDAADEASDAVDEPEMALRALALTRLHTSAWSEPETVEPPAIDTSCVRTSLEWTARSVPVPAGSAAVPISCLDVGTDCPMQLTFLPHPSVFVGCQNTLVSVAPEALAYAPALGLGPAGDSHNVTAHVVLATDVETGVAAQWMRALSEAYVRQRLGTHTPGRVFRLRDGQLYDEATGALGDVSALIQDSDAVLYLVHDGDEATLREWQTCTFALVPVAKAHVRAATVVSHAALTSLAIAAYGAISDAPAFLLDAHSFTHCTYLRERTALRMTASNVRAAHDALHAGAVLLCAYDLERGTVRIVATDERAQHTHCHAWNATDARSNITRIVHTVRAILARARPTTWHIVVLRLGAMPTDEADAWAEVRAHDVAVVCVEVHVPVVRTTVGGRDGSASSANDRGDDARSLRSARIWRRGAAPVALWQCDASGFGAPIQAVRSVIVGRVVAGDDCVHNAWVLHVLIVPAEDVDAYTRDLLTHLHAQETITHLRWGEAAPSLPWPLAILATAHTTVYK